MIVRNQPVHVSKPQVSEMIYFMHLPGVCWGRVVAGKWSLEGAGGSGALKKGVIPSLRRTRVGIGYEG